MDLKYEGEGASRNGTDTARHVLRWIAAIFFVGAGINHFVKPELYRQIVPPGFPKPALLVIVSGIGEIAGGLGLLIRPLRKTAAWGLIFLLCAVFPANVYMATSPGRMPQWHVPHWALWARLPLQLVFIVWVWFVGMPRGNQQRATK